MLTDQDAKYKLLAPFALHELQAYLYRLLG